MKDKRTVSSINVPTSRKQKFRLMKAHLTLLLSLSMIPCVGQQLQILKPDSSVFASASQYDYVAVRTVAHQYVSGQLTRISLDTLTILDRKQTKYIPLNQLTELKKTSKFGITTRRLSTYAAVAPIFFLPGANSSVYEGRTWAYRLLTRAAVIIPVGVGLGLLMKGQPLRKKEKGYSFRVIQ